MARKIDILLFINYALNINRSEKAYYSYNEDCLLLQVMVALVLLNF